MMVRMKMKMMKKGDEKWGRLLLETVSVQPTHAATEENYGLRAKCEQHFTI